MDAYTKLCNDELPNVTKELEEMTKQINDLATSTLEETRNQLADAIRKTREQEKEEQLKVLDDRIAELRKEIANLEDEDNDKQKKLAKLKAELAKWQEDDSATSKRKQRELEEQIAQLEKEILIQQKEEEIEKIEKEQEELNDLYDDILSDKEVYGEADKLLTENNTEAILQYLNSMETDYSDVGTLLGKSFTDSFNAQIQNAYDSLDLLLNKAGSFSLDTGVPTAQSAVDNTKTKPKPSNNKTTSSNKNSGSSNNKPSNNNAPKQNKPATANLKVGSAVRVKDLNAGMYVDSYTNQASNSWKNVVGGNDKLYIVNDNNGRVALSRTNDIYGALGWIGKEKIASFKTGGMLTSGDGFAMLHQGEIVFNKEESQALIDLVKNQIPKMEMLFDYEKFSKIAKGIIINPGEDTPREVNIENNFNITNKENVDSQVMVKDVEKMMKTELRKFGKIKR